MSVSPNHVKKVPEHLKRYVVDQHYDKYTAIDHAVWRFVMRQNRNFLDGRAHTAYIEGLRSTGIKIEAIPRVEDMNESLGKLGWGAAVIDGFIPGVAFFDFQAHGILPIAAEIRTLEHLAYTPTPDIIHEAAGHAPIIHDEKFAHYLKVFGNIGAKAIATKEEHAVFESIKHLSHLMENGVATEEEIRAAEEDLKEKQALATEVSEATLIGRLFWWTVEYGLIGTPEKPLIYGAGLLSSVGESRSCLNDHVKKIAFDLETVLATDYDITKPQPQLFVAESFDQLIEAVEKFAATMAYRTGGTEGLRKALRSESTATIEYASGLQVSGTLGRYETDAAGEAVYINMAGPTSLAVGRRELPGHGKAYHKDGFGAPIGKLQGVENALEDLSDDALAALGVVVGSRAVLTFESGVRVEGQVASLLRHEGKLVLVTFEDCTVTLGDQVLFDPAWGTYDMAVGSRIVSVFAGAADNEVFYADEVEQERDYATQREGLDPIRAQLNELYSQIRELREGRSTAEPATTIQAVSDALDRQFNGDWLLRIELLEAITQFGVASELQPHLVAKLETVTKEKQELAHLIDNGIRLATTA